MMGLSLAPITGKLVAEVIDGRQPSVDLTLLSPDRF
jgi:D-amino-acid dehydrogenase